MARQPVFYSFHFDNDVFRVQQVRNMGVIDGNEPVSPNDWEQVKRAGDAAVQRWIDDNMKWKRCVVVLIGAETHLRRWVKYEIQKAWNENRGLVGIYIHNLRCPRNDTCAKGANPFKNLTVGQQSMANLVRTYDPSSYDAYGDISNNLQAWVNAAIVDASLR